MINKKLRILGWVLFLSIILFFAFLKCDVEKQLIVYQPFYSKIIKIGLKAENHQKELIDSIAYTRIKYNTYKSDSVLLYYSEITPYGKYIEIKRPRFLYADDVYNLELITEKISEGYFKEKLPGKIVYYTIDNYGKYYFIKINVINNGHKTPNPKWR